MTTITVWNKFHPGDGAKAPQMVRDLRIADFFNANEDPVIAEKDKQDYLRVMDKLGYAWMPKI